MGEAIRWVACGGIGGLAALFLVGNWLVLIGTVRTRKPTSLIFPFLCGPLCAAACWFRPSVFLQQWFWVPLVLDFTMAVLVGIGITALVRWSLPTDGGSPGAEPDRQDTQSL